MINERRTCQCRQTALDIALPPFARDERLDFIEHILGVMNESRFGPGYVSGYRPEFVEYVTISEEPETFFDLTNCLGVFRNTFFEAGTRSCSAFASRIRAAMAAAIACTVAATRIAGIVGIRTAKLSHLFPRGSPVSPEPALTFSGSLKQPLFGVGILS